MLHSNMKQLSLHIRNTYTLIKSLMYVAKKVLLLM